MKRIISSALIICFLIMSFAQVSYGASADSGTCGESLTWSFNADSGELVIEGYGKMTDWFSNRRVPWKHLRDTAVSVVLPDGITHLGDYAFFGFEKITEINIPSTVKTIGNSVYAGCSSVAEVQIPNGVTSLGGWTFAACTSLESVNFPPSLTTINYECFLNCPMLMEVTIPSTLTSIGRLSLGILQSHAFNYDMIIRGIPGSNAQSYAQNYFLNFVSVYANVNAVGCLAETLGGNDSCAYSVKEMDINGDGVLSLKDSLLFKIDIHG